VLHLSSTCHQSAVAEIAGWAQEHHDLGRLGIMCTEPGLVPVLSDGLSNAGIPVGEGAAIGCVQSLWQPGAPAEIPTAAAIWSAAEMGAAAAHLVAVRGVAETTRVPLRVLVAPRLVIARDYTAPDVLVRGDSGSNE